MSMVAGLADRKVPRYPSPSGKVSRTKQSMAAECDINNIMAKFVRVGAIDHFAKHGPQYGFFPAMDFRESLEAIRKAQAMFDDLPSKTRAYFYNDPAKFLEFVQNKDNLPKMRELGLCKPEDVPAGGVKAPSGAVDSSPPKA